MWCSTRPSTWSSAASRTRVIRSTGPCSRSKGRSARSATSARARSGSGRPDRSIRSSPGPRAPIVWTGRPSRSAKVLRSMSCRSVSSVSTRSRSSTSRVPWMRNVTGRWYETSAGLSWCRNQSRSWAEQSAAERAGSACAAGAAARAVAAVSGPVPAGPSPARHRATSAAVPATVGSSKKPPNGTSVRSSARTRAMIRAASREWPPRSKRLARGSIVSAPSTSHQMRRTAAVSSRVAALSVSSVSTGSPARRRGQQTADVPGDRVKVAHPQVAVQLDEDLQFALDGVDEPHQGERVDAHGRQRAVGGEDLLG